MQSQLSQFWSSLQPRQKVALVGLVLFTAVGLSAVGFWASRPDYQVLYTGLSPEDAGRVIEHLKKNSIAYHVSAGGAVIEVPSARVYEARLDLAVQGVPSGGNVGFEIFDRSSLPGTEFTNKVNFQRALQGELARTIAQLNHVVAARVHVTIPQPRLYASQSSPPTASVVLQLKPGANLVPEQIRGIAHLVASAVEDLEAENVTIVNATGKTLAPGGADRDAPGPLTMTQLAIVEGFERTLGAHIQRMLDAVLGESKSIVTVRAELDFDTQETTKEQYEPTGTDKGYISREQLAEEQYEGAGGGSAGAPGMDSNVLGQDGRGLEPGGGGKFTGSDRTVEYQFSKTIETVKKAPGQIKRLSVAAIVDESVSSAQVSAVRNLLEAGAGISVERGDTLRVESMKMAAAEVVEEDLDAEKKALAAEGRWRFILTLARYAAIALIGLLIFKASDSILTRIQAMSETPAALAELPPAEADEEPTAPVQNLAPSAQEAEPVPPPAPLSSDFQRDPVAVADQLSSWLGHSAPAESTPTLVAEAEPNDV